MIAPKLRAINPVKVTRISQKIQFIRLASPFTFSAQGWSFGMVRWTSIYISLGRKFTANHQRNATWHWQITLYAFLSLTSIYSSLMTSFSALILLLECCFLGFFQHNTTELLFINENFFFCSSTFHFACTNFFCLTRARMKSQVWWRWR
jgi:hypothetical protein